MNFSGGSEVKASACSVGDLRSVPGPAVFLPGESHGWRSLVGYSPWGCKESDMTERFHFHFHLGGEQAHDDGFSMCHSPASL